MGGLIIDQSSGVRLSRRLAWKLYCGLGAAISLCSASQALAQNASSTAPVNLDLGSVLSTGSASPDVAALTQTPGTAPYESPSVAPLNSSQPTSEVSRHTAQNLLVPTQSWADIARLTPSVNNINPDGPGLMETSGPSLRGFQDGQYNLTFDGIPIGDSNDFTHHSTSFFTNSEIGQTIIDRGPGTAETVGDATFGGTISIRTINPLPVPTATLSGTYGSYDTFDGAARLDTGAFRNANGISGVFEVEHIKSNGALQNATQQRTNLFGKIVIPVSSSTTITLLADYNQLYQNPSIGATSDEMQALGWNYAYSNDPNSQAYWRYNNDHITTDMEYADVQSNFGGGWLYDGKIYTYAYYHHDLNGDDPNDQGVPGQYFTGVPGDAPAGATPLPGGAVPNEVVLTPGGAAQPGIPGEVFKNDYRSVGTIQRLQKDFDWGDIKAGLWFDHQVNTRFVQEVSLTNANAINYDPLDANGGLITPTNDYGSIDRLQHNQLYTFQPYGQLDWQPIDGLTLTAGVKWAYFRRALDAPVQQKTELLTGYTHNYQRLLPSFEAKYAFNPNLSGYFQAAEGFLAPNLNTYYTKAINVESVVPESTINFQTGIAYQDAHWALGGDLYTIHFQNFIDHAKLPVNGTNQTVYFNRGGVIYRGAEAEAAYSIGDGLTFFGNAGYNEAFQTSTGQHIQQAPQGTANFGGIYDANGVFASIIDQWTGGEYSTTTGTGLYANSPAKGDSPGGWYDPYNVVNVALGYTFHRDMPASVPVNLKLNLDNITNQKQIIFDNGTNGLGQTLYFRLTGFAAFVSLTVPIGLGAGA